MTKKNRRAVPRNCTDTGTWPSSQAGHSGPCVLPAGYTLVPETTPAMHTVTAIIIATGATKSGNRLARRPVARLVQKSQREVAKMPGMGSPQSFWQDPSFDGKKISVSVFLHLVCMHHSSFLLVCLEAEARRCNSVMHSVLAACSKQSVT